MPKKRSVFKSYTNISSGGRIKRFDGKRVVINLLTKLYYWKGGGIGNTIVFSVTSIRKNIMFKYFGRCRGSHSFYISLSGDWCCRNWIHECIRWSCDPYTLHRRSVSVWYRTYVWPGKLCSVLIWLFLVISKIFNKYMHKWRHVLWISATFCWKIKKFHFITEKIKPRKQIRCQVVWSGAKESYFSWQGK